MTSDDRVQRLRRPDGNTVAYATTSGRTPTVAFLGGFRSDMTGTKAMALEAWAERTRRAFVRFDYLGHGQSSGRFEDGTRVPLDVSVGDVVIYSKYGGTEVKYNGEEYLILSARDVLAVVN